MESSLSVHKDVPFSMSNIIYVLITILRGAVMSSCSAARTNKIYSVY